MNVPINTGAGGCLERQCIGLASEIYARQALYLRPDVDTHDVISAALTSRRQFRTESCTGLLYNMLRDY